MGAAIAVALAVPEKAEATAATVVSIGGKKENMLCVNAERGGEDPSGSHVNLPLVSGAISV